jgi:hypothetical protein
MDNKEAVTFVKSEKMLPMWDGFKKFGLEHQTDSFLLTETDIEKSTRAAGFADGLMRAYILLANDPRVSVNADELEKILLDEKR